ncbi:MAG: hypothetical protein ACFB6R_17485 [Alphaproteobacteria bacterium]
MMTLRTSLIAAVALCATPALVAAETQTKDAAKAAQPSETMVTAEEAKPWETYKPPRRPDGTPDLQGIWTNASVTVLERPDGVENLVLTDEEARNFGGEWLDRLESDKGVTNPDAPAPEAGQNVGGYNTFWMDPGTKVARIKGEWRSSWIVEPENGKLPYSMAGGAMAVKRGRQMSRNFDDPEVRSPGERCIVGFGSTGGPPMLNVLYNNNYQIVQTPDVVAIVVEMNHNARLVRIGDQHRAKPLRGWLGDSVGRWEGDTLVVNTTNFHPDVSLRPAIRHRVFLSPEAKVEERFTRIADQEIFYEFSVDDPKVYRQTWRGEMILRKTEGPIYEYACHEGNYALPNILGGARLEEKQAAEKAAGEKTGN